jgi:hypothetical protein
MFREDQRMSAKFLKTLGLAGRHSLVRGCSWGLGYRLVINPIALGDGLPLSKDLSEPIDLQLVEGRTFATGAALHVYQPAA